MWPLGRWGPIRGEKRGEFRSGPLSWQDLGCPREAGLAWGGALVAQAEGEGRVEGVSIEAASQMTSAITCSLGAH